MGSLSLLSILTRLTLTSSSPLMDLTRSIADLDSHLPPTYLDRQNESAALPDGLELLPPDRVVHEGQLSHELELVRVDVHRRARHLDDTDGGRGSLPLADGVMRRVDG
jgi:hypothetical protein